MLTSCVVMEVSRPGAYSIIQRSGADGAVYLLHSSRIVHYRLALDNTSVVYINLSRASSVDN